MLKKILITLYKNQIQPHDPTNTSFKNAVKITLSVSIATLAIILIKIPYGIGIWAIMASFFVPQMYRGYTIKRCSLTQLSGALIATLAVTFASFFSIHFYLYVGLMLISTLITFQLLDYGPDIFVPMLLVTLFVLFAGGIPINEPIVAIERGFAFLVGSIWALLITHFVWPFRPKSLIDASLKIIFYDLGSFLHAIIDNALRGNFDRSRLSDAKHKILQKLSNIRKLTHGNSNELQLKQFHQQRKIFVRIVALSDLLSKPNSEYFLEIIGDISSNLDNLADAIINLPKTPSVNIYQDINVFLEERVQSMLQQPSYLMIEADISCLDFLLGELYDAISASKI